MTNPSTLRRLETRKRIVDAALNIIITRGESGITMTDIYKEANISRTSLYRHFSSTKEIFRSAIDYIKISFETGMNHAIAKNPAAEDRLDVVVDYLTQFFKSHWVENFSGADSAYLRQLGLESFNLRVKMYIAVLAPFFDIVEKETGRPVDRGVVAYFITHYYASLAIYGAYSKPGEIDYLLKKLIRGLSYIDD